MTWLSVIALVFSTVLLAAALIQFAFAAGFVRHFKRKTVTRLPEEKQQGVAVLMGIRGCDPSLESSLISLLNQDFRDYEVHVVIDHESDPAWDVVGRIQRERNDNQRLNVHALQSPDKSCGLKCSSLVQALARVSAGIRYIAIIDADVNPHSTWLAELVGPLDDDPAIGLVTGNQWFEPPEGASMGTSVGSLIRSIWNAGALVPTIVFKNPWAGSLAMRLADVENSELKNVWKQSIVDDGPLRNIVRQMGKRIHFAPSLIMVNREQCTFNYGNRWVTRMLTWSRLYERTFFLSIVHAVFSNAIMLGTAVLLVAGMVLDDRYVVLWCSAGLLLSGLLSVAAYQQVRSAVIVSCGWRGQSLNPLNLRRMFALFAAVPLVQFVYLVSCVQAIKIKRIEWRGITYQINSATCVEMEAYQPFIPKGEMADGKLSI